MPYGISDQQSDCAGWAAVKMHEDGSAETIGCHETKQDAIDQMVAVSLEEGIDPIGEVRQVELNVPQYIRDAARIGLEYNAQGLAGDGLTEKTVREARGLAAGEVSEDKVVRASAWAARHAVDLESPHNSNADDDQFPAAGAVAHYLWGINPLDPKPARDWFTRKSELIQSEETNNGTSNTDTRVYADRHMDTAVDATHWISSTLDERRSVAYTTLEMRASDDGNVFTGYAAIFDSPSEPMPFVEYVRKGAFTKTLNDGADVRLLIDHEGVPLARTKSGTLILEEDDRGLRVEASLDPMNPDAQRVMSAMRRGDLSQMSFAFRTIKDSMSADGMMRELREVQLFDVSVVTYPAYEDTIAELRRAQPVTVVPSSFLLTRQRQIQIARHR